MVLAWNDLDRSKASFGRQELDEFIQCCTGRQLPTVPLFIQNTSDLLGIENALAHLVEVPQNGMGRGLKCGLSTSRHCFYYRLYQLVYIPTEIR